MSWLDARKVCIRCNGEFPIEAFRFARASLHDGRSDLCSGCDAAVSRWPRLVSPIKG